jgi:hypothetical protein
MATTTTNFGWDIPQSTDLVKDGATAIAALGQDIDTAMVDLKGGTTGQVLSKASGTDLDFSWATVSSGGGLTLLSTTSLSGSTTTVSSISGSYKNLILVIKNLVASVDGTQVYLRMNGITSSLYSYGTVRNIDATVSSATAVTGDKLQVFDRVGSSSSVLTTANGSIKLYRYTDTDFIYAEWQTNGAASSGTQVTNSAGTGKFDNTAAITSVTLFPDSGTFTGTLYIYGES